MKRTFAVIVCLLAVSLPAQARYVDFPGSWQAMSLNDGENNTVHLMYTLRPNFSMGYEFSYWRDGEWTSHMASAALLVKRWNLPDWQVNLYARGAIGAALDGDETELAGYGGAAFDAESRRYYVSYENRYIDAGDFYSAFEEKARVGFAPYVAEYGSLHTWLMLQVDHRPEGREPLEFTPLVRVFKGDVMLEFGYSDKGRVLFNAIVRF